MGKSRCSLIRRFSALTRRNPTASAILSPDGVCLLSRLELLHRALGLADQFLALGTQPGDTVVLSLPNAPQSVEAFIAARLAGLRVALVDASAPAQELERCARTVGARVVAAAAGTDFAAAAGEVSLTFRSTSSGEVLIPPATAVLKLTSGSTGLPQAVAFSIRQVIADAVQIVRTMGLGEGDRTLAAIPLTHSYGFGSCLLPLLLGGIPLVFPASHLPAGLLAALRDAAVTHFPAVPAMIRALGELADLPPLPRLRVCLSAGAPLDLSDAAIFHSRTGVKVHTFYGSSECGGITYDRSDAVIGERGKVGTPLWRVTVEVVDDKGFPCPTGVEGRVRVTSPAVALGLVPRPLDNPILGRVFLTGDLGVLDATGQLTLTGRATAALNVAGKKVHPEEVRRTIESLPGVRAAVVVGLPEHHRGDLVAALVAVDPAAGLTPKRVLAHCRAHLAAYKVPQKLVLVEKLPHSDRGKVQRERVMAILRGAPWRLAR